MFYIYILQSPTGKVYVGQTQDLEHRLAAHRRGRVYSTRDMVDFELAHVYTVPTRYSALKIETYLHKLQREHRIKEIWDLVLDIPTVHSVLLTEAAKLKDTEYQKYFRLQGL
jgi:putative endonuclease